MYIFICINLYFGEFFPDFETCNRTQHVKLRLNQSVTLLYSCLFLFSFCLPEQSNDHRCREGETAGENFMSTYTRSPLLFCCPFRKTKHIQKTKTLSPSVSRGVSASHTSSFPAAGGWGSASDDLMRPPLISISQLACCSAWLKTREGIANLLLFFFPHQIIKPGSYQAATDRDANECLSFRNGIRYRLMGFLPWLFKNSRRLPLPLHLSCLERICVRPSACLSNPIFQAISREWVWLNFKAELHIFKTNWLKLNHGDRRVNLET